MSERDSQINRRSVLKGVAALGAFGGATGTAAGAQDQHVITLHSPKQHRLAYQFAVTGSAWKRNRHFGGPNVGHYMVTNDPEDYVDGGRVQGITQGGYDSYGFTGQIVSFDITDQGPGAGGCEHADVWLDSQPWDACELITGGNRDTGGGRGDTDRHGGEQHTIRIVSEGGGVARYRISVSGSIWQMDSGDEAGGGSARGHVGPVRGTDTFGFTGSLIGLSLTGPASVYLDGRWIDPNNY